MFGEIVAARVNDQLELEKKVFLSINIAVMYLKDMGYQVSVNSISNVLEDKYKMVDGWRFQYKRKLNKRQLEV